MNVTVSVLMQLPLLQNNSQVLSSAGIANPVQYMTVMEAPDFHYSSLDSTTFVLTTLSAHHGNLDQINTCIYQLCSVPVAAILIKMGRYVNEIDPSTIAIAREHEVPLIALNSDVLFREVLSASLTTIADSQRLLLDQINDTNTEIFQTILQHSSIKSLLALLCNKISCFCFCTDTNGKRIAHASSLPYTLDPSSFQPHILQYLQDFYSGNQKRERQAGPLLILPCVTKNELQGLFCVYSKIENTELIAALSRTLVNGISLKFLEANLRQQTENEMISSIIDNIFFSHNTDKQLIAERLKLLNFDPKDIHLMVVISPQAGKININNINSVRITRDLQDAFSEYFPSVLVFRRLEKYLILLSYSENEPAYSPEKLSELLTKITSRFSWTFGHEVETGCGIPIHDLRDVRKCYNQALKAIQYGQTMDDQHLHFYKDYFEIGLITAGIDSDDGKLFFERIINPVQKHDAQYKANLWLSLETCFKNDSLESAAAALFIHISTLRYRLQKIETITGYSYFSTKDRLSLYIAYLLSKEITE